jgi:hypothetical protein
MMDILFKPNFKGGFYAVNTTDLTNFNISSRTLVLGSTVHGQIITTNKKVKLLSVNRRGVTGENSQGYNCLITDSNGNIIDSQFFNIIISDTEFKADFELKNLILQKDTVYRVLVTNVNLHYGYDTVTGYSYPITGININYISALNSDGSILTNRVKDIISVTTIEV